MGLDITPPVILALYDGWHALGRPGGPDGCIKVLNAYEPPTFTETAVAKWARFMRQAPPDLKPWLKASFPLFQELGADRLAKLVEDCAESSKAEASRPGTTFWHLTALFTAYAKSRALEQTPQTLHEITTEPARDSKGPLDHTESTLELINQTVNNYAPSGADCEVVDPRILELIDE
jgi:hypothetical protein